MAPEPNGLLVIDKPPGMTSHDVVARVRKHFGIKRVGHAGTLDPGATGVLLVGLGRATRLLRFVGDQPKEYVCTLVLGTTTNTLDADGAPVDVFDMPVPTADEMDTAVSKFLGEIDQVPPMVSAVKIGGKRLHQLARAGEEVERKPRQVTVYSLEVTPTDNPMEWRMRAVVSAGTYVRVLGADIGEALGGGAHIASLRRVAIGGFDQSAASPLDELDQARLVGPAEAVAHLRQVELGVEDARRVGLGQRVDLNLEGEGPWALVHRSGLIAVFERDESGRPRSAVVIGE